MDFTTRRLAPAAALALRERQTADKNRPCPSVVVADSAPRQYPAFIVAAIKAAQDAPTPPVKKARRNRQGFRCNCEDYPCCGHGPLANDYEY